jgi:hypothetical protein
MLIRMHGVLFTVFQAVLPVNFMTLEQCQTTIAGIGGFCQPNPSYTGRQAPIGHRQPTARDLPADILPVRSRRQADRR